MIFSKKKSYYFLEKIDIKGMAGKLYMHKYLTLTFLCLKAGIMYPPAGEWLQYETINRWSLTTI